MQQQHSGDDLAHALEVQHAGTASLLLSRSAEELGVVQVWVHPCGGIEEPGIDGRDDVSGVSGVVGAGPGESVVLDAVGHGGEGAGVVDSADVGVEYAVAIDIRAGGVDCGQRG